jgi:hypothetical protein
VARYCFYCPACGAEYGVTAPLRLGPVAPYCIGHAETVETVRDYRAEQVGILGLPDLKHEREMGSAGNAAQLFLPENKDFAGPDDPDGTKGMAGWRNKHRPKASNKRPHWPGEVEKRFHGYGGKGTTP